MAGVTNTGFVPKRLADIITGLKENAKPIFQDLVPPGEDIDTSDTSTLGRLIGLIAPDMDELWQAAHQVYQAFDPNSATGIALDNITQYIGVTRRLGSPTVLRTSVWGTANAVVPEGQVITNQQGDKFISTTALTFSTWDIIGFGVRPTSISGGQVNGFSFITDEGVYTIEHTAVQNDTNASVLNAWLRMINDLQLERVTVWVENNNLYVVQNAYYGYIAVPSLTNSSILEVKKRLTFNSQRQGDVSAPINTVTNIATPVFGWLSVTNEISAEVGTLYETDEELRERFRVSKAMRANNTSEAIYTQLLDLEGVEAVRVYENMTDTTDVRGLPEHSFMAVVRGGRDVNIGEVIWNNKPLGIESFGTHPITVLDAQGIEQVVHYSRAVEVPVYVSVTVSKTDSSFPDNGVELLRAAIVEYINSRQGFGEDVIYTRMFTPVNMVPGHQVDSMFIGTSPRPTSSSNIPLNYSEFPITFPEFVEITVRPTTI